LCVGGVGEHQSSDQQDGAPVHGTISNQDVLETTIARRAVRP
jgi:hypothetical protein